MRTKRKDAKTQRRKNFYKILQPLFAPLRLCVFALIPFEICAMTIEEKVGQLLMVQFNGEEINEDAITLLQKAHVGGFIYYTWANGLHNPVQVQNLSNSLQALAKKYTKIPLFIAIDQEGGTVTRLQEGFTVFPGNNILGMTKNPALAELCAYAMGKEMHAVGINLNLAPVIDVGSSRSYSNSPEKVVEFGERALKGYKRAGIIAALKHFPGQGDVTTDPHVDLPILHKSREEMNRTELFPFMKLANQSEMIMTAHLLTPSLDMQNCATLSKKILQTCLRKEIGFNAIIISDSMVMDAVLKNTSSVTESTIQAFEAGCDILLLGGKLLVGSRAGFELTVNDVLSIHEALVTAIKSGRISEERLDSSVNKILKVKTNYSLFDWNFPTENEINLQVKTPEHHHLSETVKNKEPKSL